MTTVASVTHGAAGWTLSLDGQSHPFTDLEQAIEEARRILRDSGGGVIDVGAGPGIRAERIAVQPSEAAVAGRPDPLPPTEAPAVPPAVRPGRGEAGPDAGPVADVAALRTSYQEARARIESFADPVERNLGLATLRLEARHTLQQMRTTGAGLSEDDLHPLSNYVAALDGGEGAERAVEGIDATVNTVLRDVWESLLAMQALGSVSVIAAAFAWFTGLFQELGTALVPVFLMGGGGVLMRSGHVAGMLGERVGVGASNWARQLGSQTNLAMEAPREIERRLWATFVPTPWRYESLAQRARDRADLIINIAWLLIVAAGIAVAIGFGVALVDAFTFDEFETDSEPLLDP